MSGYVIISEKMFDVSTYKSCVDCADHPYWDDGAPQVEAGDCGHTDRQV